MKESRLNIDNACIFRDTFQSEFNTRSLNGVPSNVVYKDGVAKIPSSAYNNIFFYNKGRIVVDAYTIRMRVKLYNISQDILACTSALNVFTTGRVFTNASGLGFWDSRGFIGYVPYTIKNKFVELVFTIDKLGKAYYYEDGVQIYTNTTTSGNHVLFYGSVIKLGAFNGSTYNIDYELLEIYNKALTSSQVKNLSLNKTYKKLPQVINTVEKLGSELVVNGDFSNGTTGWNTSQAIGYSVSNGKLELRNATNGSYWYQSFGHTGKYLKLTFTVSNYSSGSIQVYAGSTTFSTRVTSNGTYTFYNICLSALLYIQNFETANMDIDNVSVKEVISTPKKLILDVNAYDGIIKNSVSGQKVSGNLVPTIINNGAIVEQDGGHNVIRFPSAAYLDLGNYHPLTGDITVCGWVKMNNFNQESRFIYNGKFEIFFRKATGYKKLSVSNAQSVYKEAGNFNYIGDWLFFSLTRTSSGIINWYLGNNINSPVLSGTANQIGDTPFIGSFSIRIGDGSQYTIKGKLSTLKVFSGLLSLDEVTNEWSSTRLDII